MVFICLDLVVGVVNWGTLSADTGWNACDLRRLNNTHVIEYAPNAVVVCVTDVDFYVTALLVIKRRYATGLIETCLECGVIDKFVLSISKPREDLVAEGVYDLDLVVVGVCYDDHVLLWDEMNSKWMLEFGLHAHSINIAVCVQISRISVSTNQVSRALQSFHVDRSDARRLRICYVELDVAG